MATRPGPAAGTSEVDHGGTTGGSQLPAVELAARGWASRLAAAVAWLLVIQSATGLWLYLGPFSSFAELQLLVHVGIGLALIGPYLLYQFRHLATWYRQKWTSVMVIGYLLMLMVLASIVSGVVLTWNAALGPKLSAFWDVVHVTSGIGTAALIVVHLVAAVARRWGAADKTTAVRPAVQRFGWRGVGWCSTAATVVVCGGLWLRPGATEFPIPDGYTLPGFAQKFDEYQGSAFAPSYARTVHGSLVTPAVLSNSQSCGTTGCHEQIYNEWLPSAHRFSAMNPPFQAVQRQFAADREPAETRYCAGCHDPISLFAGAKDIHNLDLAAPGMQEGCSCVACHSISQVDQRGNGDYVLTPPHKYLWEDSTGLKKWVSDFLIRAYPRQHLADYDRTVLRSPEFCGACHKQFIPEALNRTGLSAGQNQYDEWRNSHWHTEDPDSDLSCIDCHMRLVNDSRDPGRGEEGATRRSPGDGAHRHHGTIATNMFMPRVLKLPNWERHVALTEAWMRGETVIEEIAHLWPPGPIAEVQIVGPAQARRSENVSLQAVVINRKAGHNFTTGPLDFMRAWVHLRVLDADGQRIAEWGAIDPEIREITDTAGKRHEIANSRKEGTLVLESEPLDQQGNAIRRHELWNKAGGKGTRVIFPSHSDSQLYTFTVPADAKGPLKIVADLNYRRYRQEFLDLVLPNMERDSGVYQPFVTQSSHELKLEVSEAPSAADSGHPAGEP